MKLNVWEQWVVGGAALGLVVLVLYAWQANAELSATVESGYTFSSGESLTLTKLNLLGQPTVRVSGTVTGSTLSTGAVSRVHLDTNVFDQVTITGGHDGSTATAGAVNYDDWSLGVVSNALAIKTNGVQSVHIAADAVGTNELGQTWMTNYASGVSVAKDDKVLISNTSEDAELQAVNVQYLFDGGLDDWLDNATPVTPADDDRFYISDEGSAAAITLSALRTAIGEAPEWSTNDVPLYFGKAIDAAHGLGRAPYNVRATLVCTNAANGYSIGDEIPIEVVHYENSGENQWPGGMVGANATNVFVVFPTSAGENTTIMAKTGNAASLTRTNWTLSVRAW